MRCNGLAAIDPAAIYRLNCPEGRTLKMASLSMANSIRNRDSLHGSKKLCASADWRAIMRGMQSHRRWQGDTVANLAAKTPMYQMQAGVVNLL